MCEEVLPGLLVKVEKLFLIGFRATGKTTVGRLVAEALGWDFLDMDEELERRFKRSVSDVVKEEGWEAFRQAEKALLKEILYSRKGNLVVSTGGGIVIHSEFLEDIPDGTKVIWLKASPRTIIGRMAEDKKTHTQRPSLTGAKDPLDEVMELLRQREPLYRRYAHYTVDVDGLGVDEIKERIIGYVR